MQLNGSYDNFLQYWKENTEEDQHGTKVDIKHRHLHIKFANGQVEVYEGRNNTTFIEKSDYIIDNYSGKLFGINGAFSDDERPESDNYIYLKNGILEIKGFKHFDNPLPYILKSCRYFAGWIMNLLPDTEAEYNRLDHLIMHDQGGMSELVYQDKVYIVELTQLEFAHTIKVFKLAFYDTPLSKVGINSKAFAYSWVNPEARRIGMNLRYVQSGWTMIEEGYVNSDNLNKK